MQTMFDLRPPHLVQMQSQKVDILRVLNVLFFLVFIMLSIYDIGFLALNLRRVKLELNDVRGEEMRVQTQSAQYASVLTTMKALRDKIQVYLAFTKEELPAVEFMASLEGAIPSGITITTMDVRPGNVLMKGAALSGEPIIELAAKLDGMKNIVTNVDAPVTSKSTLGARLISEFTITCNIKDIMSIAAVYPNLMDISSNTAGEGGTVQ
ncbi:MAG: PilN domain-containing protein [Synergistaceae bacterium]|jgi:hypothetical protein|nr:PilN domain-containing protein [Synergistaceae bacterium]